MSRGDNRMGGRDAFRLWRRWVAAFTLGEFLGFTLLPLLLGAIVMSLITELGASARAILVYLTAVVGGFGEGAVLAWFQWRVLVTRLPALRRRTWIAHTGIAASLAWALGMLAPVLDDLIGLSPRTMLAIWVPAGVLILSSIGGAQARLLSRHAPIARSWFGANLLGWLFALPWAFALPMLLPDDSPSWAFGLAMAIGGILMGATAGAITGLALVRWRLPSWGS